MNQNELIQWLRTPVAIREQSERVFQWIKDDKSVYWSFNQKNLDALISPLYDFIKEQYKDLNIPKHSRWCHFEVDGGVRMASLMETLSTKTKEERGRILFELAIISVLLDAGAGANWAYFDKQNKRYQRSEGLAIASFDMYMNGFLSLDKHSLSVDADRLISLKVEELYDGFKVSLENPMIGLEGRVVLLNKLGDVLKNQHYLNRLGNLYDKWINSNKVVCLSSLLSQCLHDLADIWPKRMVVFNHALGDVWTHKALPDELSYIPFHKLSQWLIYSLIEPLEWCHHEVLNINALTGLPEYRNGGMLIDASVLVFKHQSMYDELYQASDEAIIEWRAATVCLLDEIHELMCQKLNQSKESFPLANLLQAGTWSYGRKLAKERDVLANPPINIKTDGTVF